VAVLLALHGGSYSYQQLKDYATRLEDEFRTLRAVAKLARIGEQREEIRITSSTERVAQYALSPLKVIQALRGRNAVQYAGSLKAGSEEVPLKTSGLFQTEEEIRRVMIDMSSRGQPVYIGDLAKVERVNGEPRTLCRYNGEAALLVSVEMLEGNNIVDFGHELKGRLEKVRTMLPPDLKIDLIADQPAVVEDRITHFIREFGIAIASVILVTLLLLPFRVSLIAALAIPVTIAATFSVMHILGVELHQVSIAALIVVLGMVVDDAIVIADNYVELLDRGVERAEAAWRSATELTVPVLTATATIVAAFIPMLMISGAVGEFIQALPIAVAVSLTCSFVVAMLLTPLLAQFFIHKGLHSPGEEGKSRGVLDLMQSAYDKAIRRAMRHRVATLALGAALFVVSLVLLRTVVKERFFPTAERAQFVVHLWLPEGSRLEATDATTRQVEQHLRKDPLVASLAAFVGESAPRFYYNVDPEFPAANYAQLLVNTKSEPETPALVARLRKELKDVAPEALVLVRELEQGTVMKAPIEVRLTGEDLGTLKALGGRVRQILREAPGSEYVFHDFHEDSYHLGVHIDEETANRLGMTNESISLQLAGGFSGLPVTTFREGDRDVPVLLRLDEEYRRSFEDIGDAYVVSSLTGARVPVRSVATIEPEWRSSRILHRNGVRTLTVLGLASEGHLPSEVLNHATPRLKALEMPAGYRMEYGGEIEGQKETFGEMKLVMAVSIALIFLILLFQFRSAAQTLVVMMSIPLAVPGAVLGLLLTGNPFSFTAFMGVISLSGVVVRNAIILVEYINGRRAAGAGLIEAALEAGARRLRPIFLTTAAAAVGVTPMILSGSSLWSPLASVIAVGLICSMFFTLIVVPVLYVSASRLSGVKVTAAAGLVVLLLGGAPGARAQETRRLTIDEAVTLARKQNLVVRLAGLKVEENDRKRAAMKANGLPKVTNESSVLFNSALQQIYIPAGYLGTLPQLGPFPPKDVAIIQGENAFGLSMTTVGQPLTQLVKIHAGTHAAEAEVRSSAEDRRRAENEVGLKAQEAFLGILVYERRIEAARRKIAAAEAAGTEARDAVETGAALEVRSLEAEARLLEQKNALLTAEIQVADLRTEFNDLLGMPLETRLELVPPERPAPAPAPLESLRAEALAANPEVKAAQATVEQVRQGVKAAQAAWIPDISVFAQHIFVSGIPFLPQNNWVAGGRLSYDIFDWGKRSAETAERRVQLQQAELNLARLRNRVLVEVEKARHKVERLTDLAVVAGKAAAVRREALRIASDASEMGATTMLARRQAEAALAEAEAQELEARLGLRLATAELERTIGH
jgi:multidrug efflux pump subunit AcrB/outer membrane protein TolC